MKQSLSQLTYNITNNPNLLDKTYSLTPKINKLILKAHKMALSGNPSQEEKLKELTEQYPQIPHFKNYLSAYYQEIGEMDKANEVNDIVLSEHPDYLFGKINLAGKLISEGELDKIPEILGQEMELHALYPQRDTFHISEVISFYQVMARYYLAKEDLEGLEQCSEFLHEVAPDSEVTDYVSRMHVVCSMTMGARRMEEEEKRRIKVELKTDAEISHDTKDPVFTHPEVSLLYKNDMRIDRDLIHNILALPRETIIADLEKVLMDSIERFNHFKTLVDEGEEEWFDFPLHAIFLLSELKSEESLLVILKVLSQHREYYEFYFGDYLSDGLWEPLFNIANNKLKELEKFMEQPGKHTYAKSMWFMLVEQVVMHQPERKEEVVKWYESLIDFYNNCTIEDNIIDSDLLGLLIWSYVDIMADKKAVVNAKSLFDKGWVSTSICGTYEDLFKEDLTSNRLRKEKLLNIDERYDEILNTWNGYKEEDDDYGHLRDNSEWFDQPYNEPVVKEKKVGRNDPCPCGSGKKYKKCCLNK